MRVRLLGELVVSDGEAVARHGDFPSRQARLVFAYLAVHRDRVTYRAELAELLWPGRVPAAWLSDVSAVVSKLRKALRRAGFDPSTLLPTLSGGSYRLLLGPGSNVDVEEARTALATARGCLDVGDAATALERADAAAAQLSAGFLPVERGPWIEGRQDEVVGLLTEAFAVASEAALAASDHAAAQRRATALSEVEPHQERWVRFLMRAQLMAGERALALSTYQDCRHRLREELGVHPSSETEAVYLAALDAGAPGPDLPLPARLGSSTGELPFAGRDDELRALSSSLQHLAAGPHLVAVRGEAGIGKTRALAELARSVHGTRATVLAGRCDEEIRLPFAPIVEALDPLVRAGSTEWLAATCGPGANDLARLLPSVQERLPDVTEPPAASQKSNDSASWTPSASSSNAPRSIGR